MQIKDIISILNGKKIPKQFWSQSWRGISYFKGWLTIEWTGSHKGSLRGKIKQPIRVVTKCCSKGLMLLTIKNTKLANMMTKTYSTDRAHHHFRPNDVIAVQTRTNQEKWSNSSTLKPKSIPNTSTLISVKAITSARALIGCSLVSLIMLKATSGWI